MADMMIRSAGRGDDGRAKGIRTDDDGNIKFGQSATMEPILIAENVATVRNVEKIILSTYDIKDTASIAFGVTARTGGADIDLVVRDVAGGYVASGNNLVMARAKFPSANNRRMSKKHNLTSTSIRLAVLNHTADTAIDVYLYRFNQVSPEQPQMEFYGLSESDRPYHLYVPVGAIFMALDTKRLFQSNGTEWRLI